MSGRLIGLAAFCCCGAASFAQTQKVEFPGVTLPAPPVIDGVIGDEEWKGAEPYSFVFVDSQTAAPGRDPVIVRLAYDDKAIYVAVRVKDDPKTLNMTEYRQNVSLGSNDSIAFTLDPSGAYSAFNTFRVNPAGATTISLSGGRAAKAEWQGAFTAKGAVLEDGWSCEMAIPWKILTLPPAGKKNIPIQVSWVDSSDSRHRILAYADQDVKKLAHWVGVDVPYVAIPKVLNILPYGYAGYDERGKDYIFNGGVDFKTQLGRSGQFVGTINPDFRNIENSVLSLDFSYFERLAGEARPFFLEGSQYLANSIGRIFATQRIKDFDAGIKAYGQLDQKSNYALMVTQDFGVQTNIAAGYSINPTPNSVMRGGVVQTRRAGAENTSATLLAANQTGAYTYYGAGSYTDDKVFGQAGTFDVGLNHAAKGSYSGLNYSEVAANYFPRLGYAPDQGYRSASLYHSTEKNYEKGTLKESGWGFNGSWSEKLNGDRYQLSGGGSLFSTFRNEVALGLSYNQSTFFSSVDHNFNANISFPANNSNRRLSASYTKGDFARKTYNDFSLSGTYRLSKKLAAGWSSQWVEHYDRRRLSIFTFNYDLGDYQNFAGRLIESEGDINWHLTWRKAGKEGAEYFLILGDPNSRNFRRSLILKAVFPLTVNY